jgi:acetyl/propionyl-CoA carboxylase alpha subunit
MRRVLIANRGEIACRVIKACREEGLETVAVYSDADASALHVASANHCVYIGPAPARESYLRQDRIIEATRTAEADAIHPGYGFLSESADFARATEQAGLTWLGPSPDTIEAMGDKSRSRDTAIRAGVPVLPGSRRFIDADARELARAAETVGYPLLAKASSGGGGIGMRRVDDPANLAAAVAATQQLAQKAFGDGAIFLERFVPRARHVEVQVFGFGDGRAIHLHERDCSIQRRFQKVIEESPAPGLPDSVRTRAPARSSSSWTLTPSSSSSSR